MSKRKEHREQRNKLLEDINKKEKESDDSTEEDDDDFDEEGDNIGDSEDGWSNSSESEIKTNKNTEKSESEETSKKPAENSSSSEEESEDSSSSDKEKPLKKSENKIELKVETREIRSNSEDYRQSELYKQLEAFKSPDRVVIKKDSGSNLRKSGSAIEASRVQKEEEPEAPAEKSPSIELLVTKLEENVEKPENKLEENLENLENSEKIEKTKSEEENMLLEPIMTRPRGIKISGGSEIKSKSETGGIPPGGIQEKAADDLHVLRVRVTKQKTQSLEISKKQVENILATGGRPNEEKTNEKSPLTAHKEKDRVSKAGSDISHYANTTAAPTTKKSKHRRIKSINSVKTKLILKGKFDEISILPHSKSTNVHEAVSSPISPPASRRKSGKGSSIQSFSLNDAEGNKSNKLTQAELDLLKEVEEIEMMKASLLHPENDKKMKKKLKLEENLAEEQRKLQQLNQLQAQRTKNKTENLLPENDPDPAIRMRNLTVNEMVSSERDYVLDLELLIELFSEPLANKNIIPEQTHSSIFSTITNIVSLNKNLLAKLEKSIHSPDCPKISPFFTELKFYHKMYSDYCNNHTNSTITVASLMKKQNNFKQFIEETQMDPRCNGLFFESFLIKPVQRICKYPLLLRELIKHQPDETEKKQLESVLEDISTVVNSINETKRAAENIHKILSIQKYVEAKNNEILQPGRIFVKEGHCMELCKNGETQSIYLCLFNDVLLHGIKKKNKFGSMRRTDKFQQYENLPLYSVLINGRCSTPNALEIQCNVKKYTIIFASPTEKRDWYKILKEYIANAHTETTPDAKSTGSGIKRNPVSASPTSEAPSSQGPYRKEKIKCFVHKGTPQQRIRKVSLQNIDTIELLYKAIKKEFEWQDNVQIEVSYTDQENDLIEVSSNTSIWEIQSEVKSFIINLIGD